ncbi:polysaccharide pyruvyl transferase family protein [Desulfosporosinus sp. OT]|uniref:polysaccharide pyruvyl transferase family protein n=1 Tax=Desulfosporosinus sp. OT TaxID=913865 RepID=UPI000223A92F|nr:polysaccharide pyruvyl transferase family protein [Desulfosporosinus sp. OT]EGW38465.1 hypothetical protein DOT_3749 [Desulfosporosinus sp. OT]
MKIGICTVWDKHNYGSFLQANALKTICEQMGHNVYFLPYEKGEVYEGEVYGRSDNSKKKSNKLKYYLSKVKDYKKFQTIYQRKKVIKKSVRRTFKKFPFIDGRNLDYVIIGSDELWNIQNRDIGICPSFWAVGLISKTIVYANSFGTSSYEDIVKHNLSEFIKSKLLNIEHISVRDQLSHEIVKKLTEKTVPIVLDPTLLYDDETFIPISLPDYMLVYVHFITPSEVRVIKNFADQNRLKIYAIGNYLDFAEGVLLPPPEYFASYFKAAKYVYTSTFHGTIFSLKTGANFVSLIVNQKAQYLLASLGLSERIIFDPDKAIELWEEGVNYNLYSQLLKEKRSESLQFLEQVLV